MSYYICAEFERTAVYGGREGIINYQRNAVLMCGIRKSFYIENGKSRVCDSLTEHRLGIRLECLFKLLVGAVRCEEGEVDAHALHGHGEEIEAAAVDGGGADDMVAAAGDIKDRKEIGRLAYVNIVLNIWTIILTVIMNLVLQI